MSFADIPIRNSIRQFTSRLDNLLDKYSAVNIDNEQENAKRQCMAVKRYGKHSQRKPLSTSVGKVCWTAAEMEFAERKFLDSLREILHKLKVFSCLCFDSGKTFIPTDTVPSLMELCCYAVDLSSTDPDAPDSPDEISTLELEAEFQQFPLYFRTFVLFLFS